MIEPMRLACVLPLAILAACGGSDVIGLHVRIGEGGKAIVTALSLLPQAEAGPVEDAAEGVTWQARARLVASQGEIADLGALRLDGMRFETGPQRVRVTIPCGPDAKWIDRFAPPAGTRERAVQVWDPRGVNRSAATDVWFEIRAPERVVASGAAPVTGGVRAEASGQTATLSIPVATARGREQEIVWDVTWR